MAREAAVARCSRPADLLLQRRAVALENLSPNGRSQGIQYQRTPTSLRNCKPVVAAAGHEIPLRPPAPNTPRRPSPSDRGARQREGIADFARKLSFSEIFARIVASQAASSRSEKDGNMSDRFIHQRPW
jgi:hypothetical protein